MFLSQFSTISHDSKLIVFMAKGSTRSIARFHHWLGSKFYLIWRAVWNSGYLVTTSRNRCTFKFQMMNGGVLKAQTCLVMLQIRTAMKGVQWNNAWKWFNSCETMLAKAYKMIVNDESMSNGTNSLEIFCRKKKNNVERTFSLGSRSGWKWMLICFSVRITYLYHLLMQFVNWA